MEHKVSQGRHNLFRCSICRTVTPGCSYKVSMLPWELSDNIADGTVTSWMKGKRLYYYRTHYNLLLQQQSRCIRKHPRIHSDSHYSRTRTRAPAVSCNISTDFSNYITPQSGFPLGKPKVLPPAKGIPNTAKCVYTFTYVQSKHNKQYVR
jgi:hypothetical protein